MSDPFGIERRKELDEAYDSATGSVRLFAIGLAVSIVVSVILYITVLRHRGVPWGSYSSLILVEVLWAGLQVWMVDQDADRDASAAYLFGVLCFGICGRLLAFWVVDMESQQHHRPRVAMLTFPLPLCFLGRVVVAVMRFERAEFERDRAYDQRFADAVFKREER